MTQVNLFMKQKQTENRLVGAKEEQVGRGKDWELGSADADYYIQNG